LSWIDKITDRTELTLNKSAKRTNHKSSVEKDRPQRHQSYA